MLHPRRADARARDQRLGTGELAAAAVLAASAAWVVAPRMGPPSDVAALWSTLIPLLVVLMQGGTYWLLARRWVLVSTMPRPLARLFSVFRFTNRALLAVGLVGVLLWLPERPVSIVLVLGVWLFGVLEHVNYFVVRLSYPLRVWASQVARRRTPRLVRDVRAACPVSMSANAPLRIELALTGAALTAAARRECQPGLTIRVHVHAALRRGRRRDAGRLEHTCRGGRHRRRRRVGDGTACPEMAALFEREAFRGRRRGPSDQPEVAGHCLLHYREVVVMEEVDGLPDDVVDIDSPHLIDEKNRPLAGDVELRTENSRGGAGRGGHDGRYRPGHLRR